MSEIESESYSPVGANDDCPCGSGKKYIVCCLDSNDRWVKSDSGAFVRLKKFKGAAPYLSEETKVEEIPLLRIEVKNGKCKYEKNGRMSRLSSFPPDLLKMAISVIEVEKTQAVMEAFGKFLERTNEGVSDDEADADHLEDGSYVLLMVGIDENTGQPLGIGGRRISGVLSESSLMTLVGALEEIKTDILMCLTVNCFINGVIGGIDYGEEE